MNFTEIFIRRPVLATVISLMIMVLGLRAIFSLPILQFPKTENAVVTVSTVYYGANADVVAGFITTPLENAIAQANGIDYMTSTSQTSVSTITVNLRMNYSPDAALTEINAKVNSVLNQLPPESQQPVMSIKVGDTIDAMYIGFSSKVLPRNNITDYLVRVVQPKMQAVEGVQTAEILGGQNFALRAWIDPKKLAAYDLTASEVSQALAKNNYISGLGSTKGQMVQVNLTAGTDMRSLEEFRNLIIKQKKGSIVRLKDVANVTLGADSYDASVVFDGKEAAMIGIQVAPGSNLLQVIKNVREEFPAIQAQLPEGLDGKIIYDSTKFVNSSIDEVVNTLIESLLIVTLVVFAFLGSPRSVLIPTLAIPLSLIGTFMVMLILGFSINLLTLLAIVLAIGLVVDDAIIVVENVNRHLDAGMKPFPAAVQAAKELANPIIAMTIVLVSVYIPIGFQGGLTGALFSEFAFTLVGAVVISAIVALTLSPMLCSKLLKPHEERNAFEEKVVSHIDHWFEKISSSYKRILTNSLKYIPVTMVFSAIVIGSIYFLYSSGKAELAPQEDQGIVIAFSTPAPNATLEQRKLYSREAFRRFSAYPEMEHVFQVDAPSISFSGMVLKPWNERERTSNDIQPIIQADMNNISGVKVAAFQPSPLPGSNGLPIQFVINSTQPPERMYDVAETFVQEAQSSGMFIFINSDLKIDQPQAKLLINRDKAAQLGLTMSDVGVSLASMLGGGYVNYFSLSGRSYKVIPQVQQKERLTADQLKSYYIRSGSGDSIPVSTIADIEMQTVPESLNHFQQMNSATIQGVMFPGVSLGDAINYLDDLAQKMLPEGYAVDYGGQSRQFVQESSGFATMFLFALIIVFLTLAAQFESFRDPLIILVSVPMSIAGALVFISLGIGGASLNIYTQVGLVTLMGLISKHGILITEFANNLQEEGYSKHDAIIEATSIRFRPILMTTAAMVLGVVPLIMASGAGALSRFNMGLVVASGLSIGTLFTLFVVPAVYIVVATDHHADNREDKKAVSDEEAALI
ncbi:MAG: efflux RND transporter permease subunit [Alphaproteobacteria bacterium]|nr:efflux RND transporter permease subunit [Alphaproteobacteria bacterium]